MEHLIVLCGKTGKRREFALRVCTDEKDPRKCVRCPALARRELRLIESVLDEEMA